MRIKLAAIVMVVVAVTATLGASAFTTGSVSRVAAVNVVNDDSGLIALADGNSGDLVYQDANTGELGIDFTRGGAGGVNPDASYTLGDTANPSTTNAFTISNLDASSHPLTISYTPSDTAITTDGKTSIQFHIYDSTGSSVATVSDESGSNSATTSSITSGQTLYVVITVDTTGLTSSDSLSGTLKVSV